jgi:hypothetical protein
MSHMDTTILSPDPTIVLVPTPVTELRLSKAGVLLSAAAPRYEDLGSYMAMFGSPLSALPNQGAYSYQDPIEALTVLVLTRRVETCRRCREPIESCLCAF